MRRGGEQGSRRERARRPLALVVGLGLASLALVVSVAWLSEERSGRRNPSSALAPGAAAAAHELDAPGRAPEERIDSSAELEDEPAVITTAAEPPPFCGEDLYGTVLERETHRPVARASVRIFNVREMAENRPAPADERRTDEEGRFRFTAIGAFVEHDVLVLAEGHSPLHARLRSGCAHELFLDPALTIAGRVLHDPGLDPASDVRVWLHWEDSDWRSLSADETRTDAQGHFLLRGVPARQEIALSFAEEGRIPESRSLRVGSEPLEGIELLLGRAHELRLRAVDLARGVPLAGLRGRIRHVGPFEADGAGIFVVRHDETLLQVINGGILIEVEPEQACRTRVLVGLDELDELHDVPITRGARIEGRVSGSDGQPLAGARVGLASHDQIPGSPDQIAFGLHPGVIVTSARSRVVRTDERGFFALELVFGSLSGGDGGELGVSTDGWVWRSVPVEIPSPGASGWIDIVLERAAAVRGRVLLAGEPLSGVNVYALSMAPRVAASCFTNDAGEYACTGLASGEVRLTAQSLEPGVPARTLSEERVTLSSGETLEHDFHVVDERVPVEGIVRDENGKRILGVPVWTGAAAARTNAEGAFRLLVAPEPALLTVMATRGGVVVRATTTPGARDVELVLPVFGGLALAVVGREGRPVPTLNQVFWWPAGAPPETPYTGRKSDLVAAADGSFELELPAGRWDLELRAPYHAPAVLSGVEIRADSRAERTVTLRSGITVELSFEPDGPRPALANLRLLTEAERARMGKGGSYARDPGWLFAQPDGTLVSSGNGPGPHVLVGIPDGWSLVPERFDVPDVERHRVQLRWERLEQDR